MLYLDPRCSGVEVKVLEIGNTQVKHKYLKIDPTINTEFCFRQNRRGGGTLFLLFPQNSSKVFPFKGVTKDRCETKQKTRLL